MLAQCGRVALHQLSAYLLPRFGQCSTIVGKIGCSWLFCIIQT